MATHGIKQILLVSLKYDSKCEQRQRDEHSASHDRYDVTLPQDLASGGYLVRHEVGWYIIARALVFSGFIQIIALHLGNSLGGAEFYPMCVQIQVGGNGNGQPQTTVSFPGAYNDNDPGIYDPDVSYLV